MLIRSLATCLMARSEEHAGGGASSARAAVTPAAAEPVVELDHEALARLRELDPTGANHLLERVFQAFESSAQRLLPQMREAQRSGDHAGVRHVAHTLKSSSASIGAIKLSQLCAEIETMIRLNSLDGLAEQLERMDGEVTAVLKALARVPVVVP